MATLGTNAVTLLDWAKRLDPDGGVASIVEALNEMQPVIEDSVSVQGNLPTGHRTTIRTGLPTAAWRMLNYGTQNSKSVTQQVDDQCGILEGRSAVDREIMKLNSMSRAFRSGEDTAFLEKMSQDFADSFFYGDVQVNPERFLGLAPRFNSTSAANGGNIVSASGSGNDNASMWLVTWGDRTLHLIFPKGSKAGIEIDDRGVQEVADAQSPAGYYRAYVTYYTWKVGLTLRDWRYVARIANIDVSDLTTDASAGADLVSKAITAFHKAVGSRPKVTGKRVWYCNPTIAEYLHHQAVNKFNVNLTLDTVGGAPVTKLIGIPVHPCDALTSAEAVVS